MRFFHKRNRWMLILVIAALGIIGAGASQLVADVRFDNVTTTNCQEIEQIKTYVRRTIERASRLRDSLDFELTEADLMALKRQDAQTIERFHSEPCPRTTD